MLEVELILLILAFVVAIIAVISDIKTTEVPDYANYFLMFSALSIRILYSLTTGDWSFTSAIIISFPVVFILALLMYKLKQWGGGDAKLLMSLSIALATYPSFLLEIFNPKLVFPFPITLFTNILIIGAVYSLTYAIFLAVKSRKKFARALAEIIKNTKAMQIKILSALILAVILLAVINIPKIILVAAIVSPIILFYLYIFIKTVEKTCLIKRIPTEKLMEGDLILENLIYKNKIIHKKYQELTEKQLVLIKKTNIETVRIKEGIVFTPAFLISLIASLIFGNLFLYLL
ncbi:prepilin peptidase [Candidatus Woesearchaeota archaeon]|nr:prepilin peptidase [Candidatus Woesearchaeota archaeon]